MIVIKIIFDMKDSEKEDKCWYVQVIFRRKTVPGNFCLVGRCPLKTDWQYKNDDGFSNH